MRKQILLTLGLILLTNSIIFTCFYIFSNHFVIVDPYSGTNTGDIKTLKDETVIKQFLTHNYDISDVQSKIMSTIDEVGNSVVSIVISKDLNIYYYSDPFSLETYVEKRTEKIGGGSGIIVTKNGYILTNKHVVEDLDAEYSVVTKNGDVYVVDKIRTDPMLDIAIIHVVNEDKSSVYDLEPAKIIDFSSNISVGQFVLAIGNALSKYDNTVTLGILSAKGRQLEESNGSLYIGLYQTDTAINRGNSGGPLINIVGEVIGINTAITSIGQGIGFTIPINKQFVAATLKSIQKNGKIERPMLGVKLKELNKALAKKFKLPNYNGGLIQKIYPQSPASKAGLEKGDIILKINNVEITKDRPMIYTLFTYNIGDTIELLINRDGNMIKKEVNLFQF